MLYMTKTDILISAVIICGIVGGVVFVNYWVETHEPPKTWEQELDEYGGTITVTQASDSSMPYIINVPQTADVRWEGNFLRISNIGTSYHFINGTDIVVNKDHIIYVDIADA